MDKNITTLRLNDSVKQAAVAYAAAYGRSLNDLLSDTLIKTLREALPQVQADCAEAQQVGEAWIELVALLGAQVIPARNSNPSLRVDQIDPKSPAYRAFRSWSVANREKIEINLFDVIEATSAFEQRQVRLKQAEVALLHLPPQ